jgi:hypothetical protein
VCSVVSFSEFSTMSTFLSTLMGDMTWRARLERIGASSALCCRPRYLTCRAEGGFAGEVDESRAPEFRAGFEARLAEVETALGKHGGPFFLGCAVAAFSPSAAQSPRTTNNISARARH